LTFKVLRPWGAACVAKERIGKDLHWARGEADLDVIAKRVAELLAKPLTVDDAVQIALLNNRGLQASFQELGITEAEVVQAGRLPNPGFSFGRMSQGRRRSRSSAACTSTWRACWRCR
jgi:outer membrane protein TolC